MMARTALTVVVLAVVLSVAGPASATWSIVGVDEETGQVGVAMAGCSSVVALGEPDEVLTPIVVVPGHGAAVAQGIVDPALVERMRELLSAGEGSAAEVVEGALVADDDELRAVRQYAVVLLDGSDAAGFNGELTEAVSDVRSQSQASAQGVLVSHTVVIERTLEAFDQSFASGASLGDSLVAGLAAGSAAGGDQRCRQQTALFAHLAVATADDDGLMPATLLTVTVDDDDGQNPVELLEESWAQGRRGWIDAGLRSPTTVPRVAILVFGVILAMVSIVVIRRGMRMG